MTNRRAFLFGANVHVRHKFSLMTGRVLEVSSDGQKCTIAWDVGPKSNKFVHLMDEFEEV